MVQERARVPRRNDTKERLVGAGVHLFRSQGLNATGIKQIVTEADATFSSLYHHFPGGKDHLAAEVIATAGTAYQNLVEAVWDSQPDAVRGVREVFDGAADVLESSHYTDVCPIATVALEVASNNEELRMATADVFDAWIEAATTRLVGAGIPEAEAGRLAHCLIALLEGSFILCRATRSTEPMRDAALVAAHLVRTTIGRATADTTRET